MLYFIYQFTLIFRVHMIQRETSPYQQMFGLSYPVVLLGLQIFLYLKITFKICLPERPSHVTIESIQYMHKFGVTVG